MPENLGPSGPPADFTNASKEMLTNLATMLETLHRLHVAIGAQFAHMNTALGETRQHRRDSAEHLVGRQ